MKGCSLAHRGYQLVLAIAALSAAASGPPAARAQTSSATSPVTVVGPVAPTTAVRDPGHGYPFNATPMDLARQGYVEEEFFIQGSASRYETPQMATGSITDSGHPYKTRIIVRRPKTPSRFNGTAIVEWANVSQGHDNEADWFQSAAHFVRAGYAWVGVSAQRVGVDALKQWSPGRYGTLDVSDGGTITNDALSYDIFTAAARAIRGAGSADVMGGLKVARLIATGHSQSAARLHIYFTAVHPLAPAFEGVVLHGGGGLVRADLDVKVWKFLAETDVPGSLATRQPDTERLRLWEVAGSSHLDAQLSRGLGQLGLRAAGATPVDGFPAGPMISGGGAGIGNFQTASSQRNDGCEKPVFSRVPSHYVQNAVYDQLARWIKDGTPPPTARHIALREAPPEAGPGEPGGPAGSGGPGRSGESGRTGGPGGVAAPGAPGQAGAPGRGRGAPVRYVIARDDIGNALGGIRLAEHAVATATNTGQNAGGMFCGLLGSSEPFDNARLASLYPTHDAYVAKVREVTERNLKAGYIVKADADATIEAAKRSAIGKR